MFFNERRKMAEVAIAHGLPMMAPANVYVKSGGLMSYGPNLVDLFQRAGVYVDKILRVQNRAIFRLSNRFGMTSPLI